VEKMKTMSPPDRDLTHLQTIKDLVTDNLLPGLYSSHDYAQQQIVDSKEDIDACNAMAENMADVYMKGNATSAAEANHTGCRGEEEDDHTDMETKCNDLNTFVTDTQFPDIPTPQEVVTLRPVLKQYKSLAIEFETKDEACNSSTIIYDKKAEDCDTDQARFESSFCQYRDALVQAHDDYIACYNAANASHFDLKAQMESQVIHRKAEHKSMKKIICYLNVWLGNGDPSTVNTTHLASCDDEIDTSRMDIAYPEVPSLRVIDTAPVEDYPGTANWPNRYSGLFSPYNPTRPPIDVCIVNTGGSNNGAAS
jgi:hypothetical protein